jgi:hypothetical protein
LTTTADLFFTVVSFAAAVVFCVISPQLTKSVVSHVSAVLTKADLLTKATEGAVPAHQSQEYILDYVAYAADAAQVAPTVILPVIGTLLAFQRGFSPGVVVILILLLILELAWTYTKVLSQDPIKYVAKKWHGYTLLPRLGFAVNLIAIIVVLAAHWLLPDPVSLSHSVTKSNPSGIVRTTTIPTV